MEKLIEQLLLPDTDQIIAGSKALKEAFKNADVIPELCRVMTSSNSPQVRQYACVLLRKKFNKLKSWIKLSEECRSSVKMGCLVSITKEPERSVTMSMGQLIATIAKHELRPGNPQGWPELANFLNESFNGSLPIQTLSMYIVYTICENVGENAKPLIRHFKPVFEQALSQDDPEFGFFAIRALTHMVMHVGSDDLNLFRSLVPLCMTFIQKLITVDQDKASTSMDIFDELFESEVTMVTPHVKPIVEMCIKIASAEELEDGIRVKALTFLGRITKLKKKSIVKHKLYIPMINTFFPILCKLSEEDCDDEEDIVESNSPAKCACQMTDVLAVNLPPEKFMPALLNHVQPALESNNPSLMTGAFNSLAVSVEGCSEYIQSKHMVFFLQIIGNGIKHEHQSVQNAALYALGQFSEYLQPEISDYADEIIPVLFQFFDHQSVLIGNKQQTSTGNLERVFYALEIFCENLEEKLNPFLSELMSRLLAILNGQFPLSLKVLSVCGIGSAANATKESIFPFFNDIMGHLKQYLTMEHEEDNLSLLVQSMDTLSNIARAIGPTLFAANLAEECCKISFDLINKYDDPDVRKCAFRLFGSVGVIVQEKISAVLPQIMDLLMTSCRSKEGISLELKDDEVNVPINDIINEEDDVDDGEISLGTEDSFSDYGDVKSIKVENSFMEEKTQAFYAMKEICVNAPEAFYSYIKDCFSEAWASTEFPHDEVKKAAIEACVQFTICYFRKSAVEEFTRASTNIIPKLYTMVKEEPEISVVSTCLEQITELLKQCSQAITSQSNHTELIIECIELVMKSQCQCMDADDYDSGDDMEAEQDEILIEFAGDVIPALGLALNPKMFSPCFAKLLPYLTKKTKKNCSETERSFGVGAMAECLQPLHGELNSFIPVLLPLFMNLSRDSNENVRNNAIFGLGELVFHGGEKTYEHFNAILQNLSSILEHEKEPRVIDQIVGAVCRLIVTNKDIVPVQSVLPVIMAQLPLKKDQGEYEIFFRCANMLFNAGEEIIRNEMKPLLELACESMIIEKDDEKVVNAATELIKNFRQTLPQEYEKALSQIPSEVSSVLANMK